MPEDLQPTYETNEINANGRGSKNMADLPTTIGFVVLGIAIYKALGQLLGNRSVIIEVSNNTSLTLEKEADHHESGDFQERPPQTIRPFSAIAFSSEAGHPLEGAIGSVTYSAEGITLLLGWSNPRLGSNETNNLLEGTNKSRILVLRETGDGDIAAQMKYIIAPHPDFSVSASLKKFVDLRKGIRTIKPNEAIVSLRELVNY